MKITDEELAALPAKTKKNQAVVDLYREYDFLEAYAKHTDMRVAENPEGAVGNHTEWDYYGELQKSFLISQGLDNIDCLLDLGCGTGRLARKLVPWMCWATYWGVDISEAALAHARALAVKEGWADKGPEFVTTIPTNFIFDYIWAFSVFIHLPGDVVQDVIVRVAKAMNEDSKFLFSFVPEKVEERTGLKQYRHRLEVYVDACSAAGLSFKEVKWPGAQKIALCTLK